MHAHHKIKCPPAVLKHRGDFIQTPKLNSDPPVLAELCLPGILHGSCFCPPITWQGSGVLLFWAERPPAQRLFANHSPSHQLHQVALSREDHHCPVVPGGSAALPRGKLMISLCLCGILNEWAWIIQDRMPVKRTQPTPGQDKDFFGCFRGGGGDAQSSFYHIVFPAANSPNDRDRLFLFWGDNCGCLDVCVCVHKSVRVRVCVSLCVFPCQGKFRW